MKIPRVLCKEKMVTILGMSITYCVLIEVSTMFVYCHKIPIQTKSVKGSESATGKITADSSRDQEFDPSPRAETEHSLFAISL